MKAAAKYGSACWWQSRPNFYLGEGPLSTSNGDLEYYPQKVKLSSCNWKSCWNARFISWAVVDGKSTTNVPHRTIERLTTICTLVRNTVYGNEGIFCNCLACYFSCIVPLKGLYSAALTFPRSYHQALVSLGLLDTCIFNQVFWRYFGGWWKNWPYQR